jgi:hypothetical protein
VLDQKAIRPKLYEALKHLIITGNVLLDRSRADALRVMGIKRYVVKRSVSGKVIEILIHERVLFDELEDDVQRAVPEPRRTIPKWTLSAGTSGPTKSGR